jgi:hypothetical protein
MITKAALNVAITDFKMTLTETLFSMVIPRDSKTSSSGVQRRDDIPARHALAAHLRTPANPDRP